MIYLTYNLQGDYMLKKVYILIKKIIMAAILIFAYNKISFSLNAMLHLNCITIFCVTTFGVPAIFFLIIFYLIIL